MASVVYLTSRAPTKLIDDLMLAGHRAWECLTVSEALYICERELVDVVVIAHDVEDPEVVEVHLRQITLQMRREATAKDLIWELSQLFPAKTSYVQSKVPPVTTTVSSGAGRDL